jgi:hypothetical protein
MQTMNKEWMNSLDNGMLFTVGMSMHSVDAQ